MAPPVLDLSGCGARAVICRDGRFLLVRNVAEERSWWSLPGGGMEPGETLGDAAVREVREETGLEVRLTGLAFFGERLHDNQYSVVAYFSADVISGAENLAGDPVKAVRELRWVTPDEATPLAGEGTADLGRRVLSGVTATYRPRS